MKNTHLEHPEDSILSGDLTVLDWFTSIDNDISAKIDGSPAIVWGTEPKTGKFFVVDICIYVRHSYHLTLKASPFVFIFHIAPLSLTLFKKQTKRLPKYVE